MGKASSRKRALRVERLAEASRLKVVVCAYPSTSLEPVTGLLKAATIYGDEVLLHSPTAALLASVASLAAMDPSNLVGALRQFAPALGESGQKLEEQLVDLESQHGPHAVDAILRVMLDSSAIEQVRAGGVLPVGAAFDFRKIAEQFEDVRRDLDAVVEQQLADAGVAAILPAVEAGLLRLLPMDPTADLFDGYLEALWKALQDPGYYPLLDHGISDLVRAAIREGTIIVGAQSRSRGGQVGAASDYLARLPTFPLATMDEILDIRRDLAGPLVRFRSAMAEIARGFEIDPIDSTYDEAIQSAWVERVHPALLELEELVEQKRLRKQFVDRAPAGGIIGAAGTLVAGLISHAPVGTGVAGIATTVGATALGVLTERGKLDNAIRRHPYYLLYGAEERMADR